MKYRHSRKCSLLDMFQPNRYLDNRALVLKPPTMTTLTWLPFNRPHRLIILEMMMNMEQRPEVEIRTRVPTIKSEVKGKRTFVLQSPPEAFVTVGEVRSWARIHFPIEANVKWN